MLKAIIFLETGSKANLKEVDRHNPYALKQKLQAVADYGLDKYDAIPKEFLWFIQNLADVRRVPARLKGHSRETGRTVPFVDTVNDFWTIWIGR